VGARDAGATTHAATLAPERSGPGRRDLAADWPACLLAEVPSGVVTVTATLPLPAGPVAVILAAETNVSLAAAGPNSTLVAPLRFSPVIVTVIPAAPLLGDTRSPW
jgi:hypothetical protein